MHSPVKLLFRGILLPALVALAALACTGPQHDPQPDGSTSDETPVQGVPTPIGQPAGPAVTQTVGPAGGTVTSADGKLTLTLPAGAVTKQTPITVQPVENKAPNGTGTAYTFGGTEITVSEPIMVTYHYDETEFSGATKGNVALARQNAQGVWGTNQLVTIDPAQRTLTAKIRRVSKEAIAFIEQYKLDPVADTLVYLQERDVKILYQPGGFVNLMGADGKEDTEVFLPLGLSEDANITLVRRYGINGDQYGTTRDGTFELMKDQGSNPDAKAWFKYHAPSDAPSGNPVALFVELQHGGKEQLTLISNMFIKNPVGYSVDGKEITPIRAGAAVTPTGLTLIMTQATPGPSQNYLELFVRAPKVGHFSFNYGDASAGLSYTKGGKTTQYVSFYEDEKSVVHYTEGEINLTQFDRGTGVMEGQVRGTVVYKKPNQGNDGYTLETVRINARFKCKFGL
jgi:hypothetical protein